MNIVRLPAFNDNYIWLILDPTSSHCAVVDPGDATPVLAYLNANQLTLTHVLVTHHHADHIGGINQLKQQFPEVEVFAPQDQRIGMATRVMHDLEQFTLFGQAAKVMAVPGHTLSHISYYFDRHLFCGDTLFSAGCGRLFEGSAEQMYQSLKRFSALPGDTQVFCAHEYTQANVQFALDVEPENADLQAYAKDVDSKRRQDIPTVPTSIATELKVNPFMRCDEPALHHAVSQRLEHDIALGAQTLAIVRQWKDNF